MSQTIENKYLDLQEILKIFQNQAQTLSTPSTSLRYRQALSSLQASVLNSQLSVCQYCEADTAYCGSADYTSRSADTDFTVPILRAALSDWLVSLWLQQTPFSTASQYLDIISALYTSGVKNGILPKTTLFSTLKSQLKELGPQGWKKGIDDQIFERALRLTKNAAHLIADDATAAAMVIWSLTHSLQPLTEVALQKKSARYSFPLRQSYRTPKQLNDHINKIVNALFRRARLPQATNPFDTVESLWAYAALRAGIPASALVSYLGHAPLGLPVLRLSHAKTQRKMCAGGGEEQASRDLCLPVSDFVSSKKNLEALREIGNVFIENPPQWYAMSLRPGVRFTQVCRRIQLLFKTHTEPSAPILRAPFADTSLSDIQLFYPCEEIARVIGKKIVTRQRPFIHSVVFFRAKLTDIGRLFSHIGDLAWCYRQNSRPGAPYAAISDTQFQLFQQTIAQFTPDYEVAPAGELELNEGDRVEILGGLFSGHEAIMEERLPGRSTGEASGVIYRLNIIGANGIEWRITADSRLLKTIPYSNQSS